MRWQDLVCFHKSAIMMRFDLLFFGALYQAELYVERV